jgi:hypothetical protein
MPGWLEREQFKQDSIRAFNWFKRTNDTSVQKRFIRKSKPKPDSSKLPATRLGKLELDPAVKPKNPLKLKQHIAIT